MNFAQALRHLKEGQIIQYRPDPRYSPETGGLVPQRAQAPIKLDDLGKGLVTLRNGEETPIAALNCVGILADGGWRVLSDRAVAQINRARRMIADAVKGDE